MECADARFRPFDLMRGLPPRNASRPSRPPLSLRSTERHASATASPIKPIPKVERPKRTLDARNKPAVAVGVPIIFTRETASAQTVGSHCRGCGWAIPKLDTLSTTGASNQGAYTTFLR